MQRSSLIATVIATAGIVGAASVASIAVVNAASSSDTDRGQISLVSATVAQTSDSTPTPSNQSAEPAPSIAATDLPALPTATPKPKKPSSSTRPSSTPSPKGPSQVTNSDDGDRESVSSRQAVKAALAAADGSVTSVTKVKHGSFQAWAVRINRTDGSTVTGYVDRVSGTVYDWVVNSAAPSHGNGNGNGNGNNGNNGSSDDDSSGDDDHGNNHGNGNGTNGGNGNNGGDDHGHDGDDD